MTTFIVGLDLESRHYQRVAIDTDGSVIANHRFLMSINEPRETNCYDLV